MIYDLIFTILTLLIYMLCLRIDKLEDVVRELKQKGLIENERTKERNT